MYIEGHAFKSNENEMQEERRARYKEIKHLGLLEHIELSKSSEYGHTKFRGRLLSDDAKALSEFDIALIADMGNLCFGGECTKRGDSFTGHYNTD